MADEAKHITEVLAHKTQEFWDQLVAEVGHTYFSFFHYASRFIETNFYLLYFNILPNFQDFSLYLQYLKELDPSMSFLEVAIALWEQEEGSYHEKVSLFYSLHSLDSLILICSSFYTPLPDF